MAGDEEIIVAMSAVSPYQGECAVAGFPIPPSPSELRDLWDTIRTVDQIRLLAIYDSHFGAPPSGNSGKSSPSGHDFIGRAWAEALNSDVSLTVSRREGTMLEVTVQPNDRTILRSISFGRSSADGKQTSRIVSHEEIDPEKTFGRRFFNPEKACILMQEGMSLLCSRTAVVDGELRAIPLVEVQDAIRSIPQGLVWLTRGIPEDLLYTREADRLFAEAGIFSYRQIPHSSVRGMGRAEGILLYREANEGMGSSSGQFAGLRRDEDALRRLKEMALRNMPRY